MYSERANQFASFAALRGFEEMVRQRERVIEPRRELSEDEAEVLSRKMNRVRCGQLAAVTYYDKDGYTMLEGMVSGIDRQRRTLTIVKTVIPLDDIRDISGEGIDDIFE